MIWKLAILIMITSALTGCKEENSLSVLTTLKSENGFTYQESLTKWSNLKKENSNSYVYQTRFASWTGFEGATEIQVTDGKVTARIYEEYTINIESGEKELVDSYTETDDKIGTHEKGARALTIDELYYSCSNDYLSANTADNTLYFETELTGLMTLCGYVPNGCMDDCFQGISIDGFDWDD